MFLWRDNILRFAKYHKTAEENKFHEVAELLIKSGALKTPVHDVIKDAQHGIRDLFGKAFCHTPPAPSGKKSHTPYGGVPTQHAAAKETKGLGGIMADTMAEMNERGERLENMDNKAKELESNASEYKDLAKQLKEKAKKQNIFGF